MYIQKLILKPGSKLENIQMYGCWVHTIEIDAVEYMEVEWQDCDKFVGKFQIQPEIGVFRVKYPISQFGLNTRVQASIELKYFPILF